MSEDPKVHRAAIGGSLTRLMREDAGLTVQQLADKLGCLKKSVYNVERQGANPTARKVSETAQACGITPQRFLELQAQALGVELSGQAAEPNAVEIRPLLSSLADLAKAMRDRVEALERLSRGQLDGWKAQVDLAGQSAELQVRSGRESIDALEQAIAGIAAAVSANGTEGDR